MSKLIGQKTVDRAGCQMMEMHAMIAFEELRKAWIAVERRFMLSRPLQRLVAGSISLEHYAAYLRETYFYTRENPQIQAMATAWFRSNDRQTVKAFLRHALSETGHDQLALSDLEALGFNASSIPDQEPLPTTIPLISFPYYAIQYRSPISYLGYLFFLEFLPTSQGGDISSTLARHGVPSSAMSFLREHQQVDVHHNKLMEQYAKALLTGRSRIDEVIYAMEVTGRLFANMIEGAYEAADAGDHLARNAVVA